MEKKKTKSHGLEGDQTWHYFRRAGHQEEPEVKTGVFGGFFTRRQTALDLIPLQSACAHKESEIYRDSKTWQVGGLLKM